jgi:hypothetical protein
MVKRGLIPASIALAVAGCGGGGRQGVSPPSRATFVAAVERICVESNTRAERLTRLRRVRPPKGAEDLYLHWLAAESDALAAAASRSHPPKKSRLDPAVALAIAEGKVAGYARRLGARTCAKRTTGTMPR